MTDLTPSSFLQIFAIFLLATSTYLKAIVIHYYNVPVERVELDPSSDRTHKYSQIIVSLSLAKS